MFRALFSEGSERHSGKYSTSQNCQETHGSKIKITWRLATRRSSESPAAKFPQ